MSRASNLGAWSIQTRTASSNYFSLESQRQYSIIWASSCRISASTPSRRISASTPSRPSRSTPSTLRQDWLIFTQDGEALAQ